MKKKYLLITICTLSISVFSSDTKNEISNLGTMLLIHKTPTCGCCKEWVKHVKENGFNVHTQDHQSLLGIKNKHNINPEYRSCHTTVFAKSRITNPFWAIYKPVERYLSTTGCSIPPNINSALLHYEPFPNNTSVFSCF